MYPFDQQIGADHCLPAEMVDDRGVIANPQQRRRIFYFDIRRQPVDQSEFSKRRYFGSGFTHNVVVIYTHTIRSQFRMPVIHDLHKFIMDPAVGGNDMRLIRRIRTAREVRDPSSRLLNDQEPRRAVPRIQLMLIEPVESAGRHPAKIHRRGSQAPDRHPRTDQPGEYLQRTIRLVQVGIRETRDQAGFQHRMLIADCNFLIVQGGAISPLRKIEFIDERIVHRPHDHLPLLLDPDRNTADRETMGKIDRSVDRVDDPLKAGIHDDLARFFAQEGNDQENRAE